ncbi:hypothetical protein BC792_13026 [Sphingobacterium allocomposti]|jgi:iron complex transport system substrate-binding protein|uniref:Iron complex transport system substrate-binding protein n=1 Tax=Sphingobacterium allocomposti TaxID=415956 RepID=A0A5S5CYU8_9SPHI|nr:ABC transporter substrate-binding protein [Sphingobacterium composti Yoo et al. 2007 non Ten et al. 2007]TYP88725.1 hypothetical protein BC792_13026 [Sphingobacterium composti Yoo et al. 2007 non Ten et al. 2007]HLS94106.1 hypothetical protein [Sphingobacterium sp.]
MQELPFFSALLNELEERDPERAALLEEEANILIHKLKFVPTEQRPSVLVLSQKEHFRPLVNEQTTDSTVIAGAIPALDKYENPAILIIVQDDPALYGELPSLLQDDVLSRTDAVMNNQIYIVQKSDFGRLPTEFLRDVEICAEIVQPKYFIYGRQGTDWVRFDMA